jgi:hypothetical protein
MLTFLDDKLMPRDLAAMERYGCAEIVRLVGRGRQATAEGAVVFARWLTEYACR